jgi:ATP-binding cassette subfamily B protein
LFPFYKQLNAMDCGPTCLRMVAKYYGRHYNNSGIKALAGYGKEGVSLLGISEAAEKIGFAARGTLLSFSQLTEEARLPCILHWNQNHFVVLIGVKKSNLFRKQGKITIADPARGILACSPEEFMQSWLSRSVGGTDAAGMALLLQPTSRFYEAKGDKGHRSRWSVVWRYLLHSRWQLTKVFITLLVTSLLQLAFPFLTQSIVDTGIHTRNLSFVTIVLTAQLMLLFSQTMVEFIRSRLLLHISTVVNLSILSDFWIKLTRLPLSHFDIHHTGDTMQRIGDNKQIQNFLTGSALNTFFSLFNLAVYGVVLAMYNVTLFLVFALGSLLYFFWMRLFLRLRRKINYQNFHISTKENTATLQLVQGMQEIRLNNAENIKRWEWENIQASLFRLSFKSLTYSQVQQAGSLLINHGKDIIITFLVAGLVIDGRLTLGTMLAIQYIIGQLTSPIDQLVGFTQSAQDARISMERLNEIHQLRDEESADAGYLHTLPGDKTIRIRDLCFTYPGQDNEPVLKNIDLDIPEGRTTAIVGTSGSGKTTLLKILLKFYDHYTGDVKIGETGFAAISPSFWRSHCGAVLQNGYIFNDSIAGNIAVGAEVIDQERLEHCCSVANILSFIVSLPNGFRTKLGAEGAGISQGQKQRLLIARALYRAPDYLFFDEATNALDTTNEKEIVENLKHIFSGRTVVVVAHRLSTVKHADKIIVLHEGRIAEEGTHLQLSRQKGRYLDLIKDQLELDN